MTIARRDFLKGTAAAAGASTLGAAMVAGPAAALGAATAAGAGASARMAPALQLAKVWVDRTTVGLLDSFDDTHRVFDDGSVELLIWPGDLARLQATGLRHEITVDDVAAWERSLTSSRKVLAIQPGETANGQYRTLAQFNAEMAQLAVDHPTRCKLIELPETSREGRTVFGLEICSDVNRRDGRPVFYMDGIHHAREWPAAELPIMLAYDLLQNYGSDAKVTALVDGVRFIIVPVMNPDGFDFSRSDITNALPAQVPAGANLPTGSQYWRKNRRSDGGTVPAVNGYDYHAFGVDPNRNHAFAWGGAGSSASSSSDTYRGDVPQSEPETRNVASILKANFVPAMITNHTSGDYVLYAYSWTDEDVVDQALIEGLGRAMATFNNYRPQKSIDLYIHTGVCVDYAYGVHSSISYTFEHGASFHPAYADNIPDYYAENREAYLLLAIEGCLAPEDRPAHDRPAPLTEFGLGADDLHHAILTGQVVDASGNGIAAQLRLSKAMETPLWFEGDGNNPTGQNTFPEVIDVLIETAADGTFTWHVNDSTRPHVRLAGGTESYELSIIASGNETFIGDITVGRGERRDLGLIAV